MSSPCGKVAAKAAAGWILAIAIGAGGQEQPAASFRHAAVPEGFRVEAADGFDPDSDLPRTIVHGQTGYRLRLVPAGEFLLGSPEGMGLPNERPQRRIFLDAYWIGETPVTCAQFARFLNERGNRIGEGVPWVNLSGPVRIMHADGAFFAEPGYEDHPGVCVSWYGARAFTQWMGGQLPTELQWEKAVRGGREGTWPWGDTWDRNRANTAERIAGVEAFPSIGEWREWREFYINTRLQDREGFADTTTPVRRYAPNGYGLYDMAGNVREWCEDWYARARYLQLQEGQRNPRPPLTGDDSVEVVSTPADGNRLESHMCRVVRGGGWYAPAFLTRCAARGRLPPASRDAVTGFRVVVLPGL